MEWVWKVCGVWVCRRRVGGVWEDIDVYGVVCVG